MGTVWEFHQLSPLLITPDILILSLPSLQRSTNLPDSTINSL